MLAGNIPDIIELGHHRDSWSASLVPYRTLADHYYLEDLYPYIENDPELGRDALVEAPLRAAEIDGKLYVAFSSFSIETLAGPVSVVGDRYSWTLEELRAAYSAMPEDSTVLNFYATKGSMFQDLGLLLVENYVDWETGQCSFDSESFRSFLEFINSFPTEDELPFPLPDIDVEGILGAETAERIASGRQMLVKGHSLPLFIQMEDMIFGERTAYIGYPVADGSVGSYFRPSYTRLAITSTCKNKEAAWEYVRQMFLPRFSAKTIADAYNVPINRADYDRLIKYSSHMREKDYNYFASRQVPRLKLRPVTDEEIARFEDFLNSIDKIALCDNTIYRIVAEQAGAYFAGDWTLDKTVDQIQRRVKLYVNEQR